MDAKEVNIHARCHAEAERLDRDYRAQVQRQREAIDRFVDYLQDTGQMGRFQQWSDERAAAERKEND